MSMTHTIRGSLIHYVLQFDFSTTLTITLSTPVFRRPPPPPPPLPPPSACTHLTILSNQLSMTPDNVVWGMPKMTPSMNAWAYLAFWNCFPFSCHLMEGNKNQSQGVKSGEKDGWVTSWTSMVARKARVTAAVSALALSWWSSRPRRPVRGRYLHHAWKLLGKQWLTY